MDKYFGKIKCLVYLGDNYQDVELISGLAPLKRADIFSFEFRGNLEESRYVRGQYGLTSFLVKPLKKSDLASYDAIFITGGAHCQGLRFDPLFKEVAEYFFSNKLAVFAICDAPNVLYELGILPKDAKYTSYPIGALLAGPGRLGEEEVVYSPEYNLITARDPASALKFGEKIVAIIDQKRG